MLKQTAESNDQGVQLELGGRQTYVDFGSISDLLFNLDRSRSLGIEVEWDQPQWPAEVPEGLTADKWKSDLLSFSAQHSLKGKSIRCDRMSYCLGDFEFGIFREEGKSTYEVIHNGYDFVRPRGRPSTVGGPVKTYGFPASTRLAFTNASFLQGFELAFEKQFEKVLYLGPLREDPQRQYTWSGAQPVGVGIRGELVVDALLAARERGEKVKIAPKKFRGLEQYVAHWLKQLDLVSEFKVEEVAAGSSLYRVLVKRSKGSAWVAITDVGFGVSQILPVLTLCFAAPIGSTIILEQPEIHLHPSVQAGLADVFIDAMKIRKVQLIVESHSEHFLQRLLRRVAESDVEADSTALYFCDNQGGASTISALDVDMFGSIRNWPDRFFGDPLGESIATARAASQKRLPQIA
jgi:AAA domain, putative AbiEii toxin, Type IV TA system/Protein of unknown function (DUF3696)